MGKDRTKIITGVSDVVLVAGRVQEGDSDIVYAPSEVGGFPMIHAGFPRDEKVTLRGSSLPDQRALSGERVVGAHDVELMAEGMETGTPHLTNLDTFVRGGNRFIWYLRKLFPQVGESTAIKVGDLGTILTIEQNLHSKGKSLFSLTGQRYTDELGDAWHDPATPGYYLNLNLIGSEYEFPKVKAFVDYVRAIRQQNLSFSVLPDLSHFGVAASLYDCGPSRLTGTLYNTPTWSTPFLRFDGVSEYADFGDVLDDDGVSDRLFECWIRIQAADGVGLPILAKKQTYNSVNAGFSIFRFTGNQLIFQIADGTTSANIATGAGSVMQNTWKHFAVTIDRNGNGQAYLNGALAGSATSVAAIGSGTNALSLFLGRDNSGAYGQVDLGRVRTSNFGAGGLPSNIANIVSAHYNAEKSIYGL